MLQLKKIKKWKSGYFIAEIWEDNKKIGEVANCGNGNHIKCDITKQVIDLDKWINSEMNITEDIY